MEQRQGDTKGPPAGGGTLELILYRLEKIETQTVGLVSLETYNLRHDQLAGRVSRIETARVAYRKNIKGVAIAVGVALTVPVLTNLTAILEALGGAA